MLLWEVLFQVRPEYEKATRERRRLEWLADRLPNCFLWTRDTDREPWTVEEPEDWNGGREFDRNYDALIWLAGATATGLIGPKSRRPRPRLTPAIARTLQDALLGLGLVIMADPDGSAELALQFSTDYREHGQFATLKEFWEVAFISFFRPEWLPWRGSYCMGCGRPMGATKKLKKPSGTRLCSGCRVRKCRDEAKAKGKKVTTNTGD
jgi:hypothetical protein